MPALALQRETEFFQKNRQTWLAQRHEGKWAVISGDSLLGFFPDFDAAYAAGSSKFGATPFMVRKLLAVDELDTIQRVHW